MGTFESFRKVNGALKDSTKVGLAKVNSEFKDLDIAIVKATNHVECPPKERHIRKIFTATSMVRPWADVAYCIHALAKRLSKTRNWIVALKTLIVIHRTLREGDPTFREELMYFSRSRHILQISHFKDDSSPLAWDCSAWLRTYAQYLEVRLECFRVLKYDIDSERLTRTIPESAKVHSRTPILNCDELLEQLPALQQLLQSLVSCQPEGRALSNYLIQYALALVLKESFRIYCAINDGIINLVDMFFNMSRHDAIEALHLYKRAGQQAEILVDFYQYCKALEVARNFKFPILRQPPPSFLAAMEEYVREAPQSGSANKRKDYQDERPLTQKPEEPEEHDESEKSEKPVENAEEDKQPIDEKEESQLKEEGSVPLAMVSTEDTWDILGMNEINSRAAEIEEGNSLALAIIPPGGTDPSTNRGLSEIGGTSGWELALVTTSSNDTSHAVETKLAGGFDKLLLDSLYEDENARQKIKLQNAGYGGNGGMAVQNPFSQHDPFAMSNSLAPPTNVQMALMARQQQLTFQQHQHMTFQQHQQLMFQQQPQQLQQNNMMVPYQSVPQHYYPYPQQHMQQEQSNPFGDPFLSVPQNLMPQQGNHHLM